MVIATAAVAAAPAVIESATDKDGFLNKVLKIGMIVGLLVGLLLGYMILNIVMDLAGIVASATGGIMTIISVLFGQTTTGRLWGIGSAAFAGWSSLIFGKK